MSNIPLVDLKAQYQPLKQELLGAIAAVLEGMALVGGPNLQAFEEEFAAFCGTAHAVGLASGTEALHLALEACGVGPGDEVITTSHGYIATVEAMKPLGARPVFVDVEEDSLLMDVTQLEARITPRTKAIIPVHLYGQVVDMAPLMALARRHNLKVIEDACQAHGATYKGKRAGSLGDAAAFSFYMSKNLGGYGEAGAAVTNDRALAERMRLLRSHGESPRYHHWALGVNGRLDELQAAILRVKLKHLEHWNQLRRQWAALYSAQLQEAGVILPHRCGYGEHVYHLYVIRSPHRDALRAHLEGQGIGTGVHYPIPIHRQRALEPYGSNWGELPVTERIVGEILSLPMYPELTPSLVRRVAEAVASFRPTSAPAGGRP